MLSPFSKKQPSVAHTTINVHVLTVHFIDGSKHGTWVQVNNPDEESEITSLRNFILSKDSGWVSFNGGSLQVHMLRSNVKMVEFNATTRMVPLEP